jgi:hypothetical protein
MGGTHHCAATDCTSKWSSNFIEAASPARVPALLISTLQAGSGCKIGSHHLGLFVIEPGTFSPDRRGKACH